MRSPRFRTRERVASTGLLHPDLRRKVEAVIADLAMHGQRWCIYETYRSQARQEELYRQGATKLRRVGMHGYGLAADLVRLDRHGNPTWDGDYSILGRVADAHNLVWGGDWGEPGRKHEFVDADHVQLCRVSEQNRIFSGEYYPACSGELS